MSETQAVTLIMGVWWLLGIIAVCVLWFYDKGPKEKLRIRDVITFAFISLSGMVAFAIVLGPIWADYLER